MTALVWAALAVPVAVLAWMTWQVLTHDPALCRTCVDRRARDAARRRHPSRGDAL
jgi:heme exporter protein D